MPDKIEQIKKIVEQELSCSVHNMDHVMRVYNLALKLAQMENNVDLRILEPAVLLHDIARVKEDDDSTGGIDHAILGAEMADKILRDLDYANEQIGKIKACIISHRYRTGVKPETIEARILFDADKLDALGAIGIARSFGWVGRNGARMYYKVEIEEYIKDNLGGSIKGRIQDKTKHSPQIELEAKIKFLPDKLYTESAKQIGQERLEYYKHFLDRLEQEVNGQL